ncbi:MAG: dihydropteroate synthase [Clostridiales bacterium]|nr:dihydropteroate synthase [Clostridiales bacterium]
MTRQEFDALIKEKVVILDGATGSNLQQRGMPSGVSPEKWIMENPEVFIGLQVEYLESGSDILLAPTFTSNRIKLAEYGLQEQIAEINHSLVKLSKEAIQRYREKMSSRRDIYIAADMSMTGEQVYPLGTLTFEELVEVYKEQVGYCIDAGVDLIIVETMMSLQECRAALLAVKETCDLPIMVSLTFEESGRTLYGTDPKTAVIVLQSMGADAIGINCSTGPDRMHNVLRQMKEYAHIPILVKPNAGIPKLMEGQTIFPMQADEFADAMKQMVLEGANLVGGCCGSTPEHIRQMVEKVKDLKPQSPCGKVIGAVTTERSTVEIPLDGHFIIVGERINPTGKKAMQEELRVGDLTIVSQMANEQTELGAEILDINVGMNGIDEKETMIEVLYQVLQTTEVPLSIDTSDPEVMEAALRIYPGRALINSISYKEGQYEKLLAMAKKYGAMFILLPLSDKGMPKDMEEKRNIIHTILDAALAQELSKEDIIVDGLVTTLGADPNAASDALNTIRYCKETLGLATTCGLSNISFGMPERQFINSTFLAFAIQAGLTMAIANPSQDLIMNTALASDLICAKEASADRYVTNVRKMQVSPKGESKQVPSANNTGMSNEVGTEQASQGVEVDLPQSVTNNPIYEAVVKGNKKNIVSLLEKELEKDNKPEVILDSILIPAITEVGRLYDKQIYFLPQLIAGAKVMEDAVAYLEPLLQNDKQGVNKGTIIIATVAGDIHDIGKNLVSLMLKNYGYTVIDLGKDVSTEDIITNAKELDADIIAVSALMTTTMTEMERIVKKVKSEGLRTKVIIGGAAVTESYRLEIGADGYSEDAQSAVKLVNRLMGQ